MKNISIITIVSIIALCIVYSYGFSESSTTPDQALRELVEDHVLGQKNLHSSLAGVGMIAAVQKNKEFGGEEQFSQDFKKLAHSEVWLSRFMDLYSSRFTEEEIASILEYRRSSVWKKEMDLAMELGTETLQALQDMVDEIIDRYPDATPPVQEGEKVSVAITTENFEQEIQHSELPVVVKVHATWCGPCKALEPIFDSLASEYLGTYKFASLDFDEAGSVAKKYGVTAMPTVLFIKDGELVEKHTGLLSQEALKAKIQTLLG